MKFDKKKSKPAQQLTPTKEESAEGSFAYYIDKTKAEINQKFKVDELTLTFQKGDILLKNEDKTEFIESIYPNIIKALDMENQIKVRKLFFINLNSKND